MKKYAFAVEIEPDELFEIFELVSVPDTFPNIQKTWSDGLAVGVPTLVRVSGVDGISSGDTYSNGVFTNNSETNSLTLSEEIVAFALVSDSTVYGFVSTEAGSFNAQKYLAATEGRTVVLDATENQAMNVGALWNGTEIVSNQ